jgi:hypothetical protein
VKSAATDTLGRKPIAQPFQSSLSKLEPVAKSPLVPAAPARHIARDLVLCYVGYLDIISWPALTVSAAAFKHLSLRWPRVIAALFISCFLPVVIFFLPLLKLGYLIPLDWLFTSVSGVIAAGQLLRVAIAVFIWERPPREELDWGDRYQSGDLNQNTPRGQMRERGLWRDRGQRSYFCLRLRM